MFDILLSSLVIEYRLPLAAPRTGLPFVLPVSFDKIDNNNSNNFLFQKNRLTAQKFK